VNFFFLGGGGLSENRVVLHLGDKVTVSSDMMWCSLACMC